MILYKLHCVNEHEFEAWFNSSESYDEQLSAGDVECPHCGSLHVAKAPMAPQIAKRSSASRDLRDLEQAPATTSDADEQRAQDLARQILRAVDKLREHVEENFDDVGENFAEEARKIHAGESEDRGIYGTASDEEAHELTKEEIEFFRIPTPSRRDS
jgi:hypothetical protein